MGVVLTVRDPSWDFVEGESIALFCIWIWEQKSRFAREAVWMGTKWTFRITSRAVCVSEGKSTWVLRAFRDARGVFCDLWRRDCR